MSPLAVSPTGDASGSTGSSTAGAGTGGDTNVPPPAEKPLAMDLKPLLMLLPLFSLGEAQAFDYRQYSSSQASAHLDGRSSLSDHEYLTENLKVMGLGVTIPG